MPTAIRSRSTPASRRSRCAAADNRRTSPSATAPTTAAAFRPASWPPSPGQRRSRTLRVGLLEYIPVPSLGGAIMNRRDFLQSTTAGLSLLSAGAYAYQPAQKKPRVGLIGCGWYGKCDLFRLIQVAPVEVV